MNETNNNQRQKPKTSKLAIASIICLGLFFGLIAALPLVIIFALLFTTSEWAFGLCQRITSLASLVTLFATPILGVAALIHIGLSKEWLRGIGLAITAIVISMPILLFLMSLPHLIRHLQRTAYISGLENIGTAIKLYANEYDGHLPTPQNWCDLLLTQDDIDENLLSGHRKTSDAAWGESAYALNKSVVGMKLSEIPGDVVLLFETIYGRTDSERDTPWETRDYFWKIYNPNEGVGPHRADDLLYKDRWNQVGGVEILTTEYYLGEECLVLFADGHAELIKKEELDTLRWEP